MTITRKVDSNWFEGKLGSRKGIFPISYVEVTNLMFRFYSIFFGGFENYKNVNVLIIYIR